MNITDLTEAVRLPLKELHYRKRSRTWVKESDDKICIVVNIQGSAYSRENFYLNLGVYFNEIGDKEFPNINISDCHMTERIAEFPKSAEMFMGIVNKWEEWYGTADRIRLKINEGKMPMMTDKRIYAYFLVLN